MSWQSRLFLAAQWAVPAHGLSRLVARAATSRRLRVPLIRAFCRAYDIALDEAEIQQAAEFECFNHFFTRALRPGVRPVDPDDRRIVSPVDGNVSQCGHIEKEILLQAKGQHYTLTQLLGGDVGLARQFQEGEFATIYLAPNDYHRIHMPVTGRLESSHFLPGALFSVNQTTAMNVPNLFARNERLVCIFNTPFGRMACILVGAMIVAGIETVWGHKPKPGMRPREDRQWQEANIRLGKGQEMGRFLLGSTVILLFEAGRMRWMENLGPGAALRYGEAIGEQLSAQQ